MSDYVIYIPLSFLQHLAAISDVHVNGGRVFNERAVAWHVVSKFI